MSTVPSLPPKEDVAKEIGRVASTLTDDMQNAALKKARELGFDLARGRISLEETLINLSYVRDLLLDASNTDKLVHLPLKLQYILYSQAQKVSETLNSLVQGTDAVQALEDVVDDLTSSAWQYNLHNLSGQVLGFEEKMNQLKSQETLIRKAHREAKEFEASSEHARELLGSLEGLLSTAKERDEAIKAHLDQVSAALTRATESEQKIAGLAAQAEQHDSAATRHETNAKAADALAQTIADSLPTIKADLETAIASVGDVDKQIRGSLSTLEQTSQSTLTDFQTKYGDLKAATETATTDLQDEVRKEAKDFAQTQKKMLTDAGDQLDTFKKDHDKQLSVSREAVTTASREAIEKLNTDFQTVLKDQDKKYEEQRIDAGKEYTRLVSGLDELESQIKDSIRRATGFSLFHSFQKRQEDLVKSKNFWAKMLTVVVLMSVGLSIALIVYLHFTSTELGPAFYLKLSISLPMIYAIWFCSVQYTRERRLEEEYAFKSSISISLDPYRELVEKLIAKDKPEELAKYTAFIIESVGRVFTSPMETAFDHTKDTSPAESIVRATGDLVKDVLKLAKK